MTIKLFMDVHVRASVTKGLRQRRVDVLTAQEDGSRRLSDPALLDRSAALGRVLFSQDADLLVEAAKRQASSEPFCGFIYAKQGTGTDGKCIDDLELISTECEATEVANIVVYLPL